MINYKLSYYYISFKQAQFFLSHIKISSSRCWGVIVEVKISVAVHLNLVSVGDALLNQEFEDFASVVTLQLDHSPVFFILHASAVATPAAFELTDDLLQVEVVGEAFDEGQTLTCRTLLEFQV